MIITICSIPRSEPISQANAYQTLSDPSTPLATNASNPLSNLQSRAATPIKQEQQTSASDSRQFTGFASYQWSRDRMILYFSCFIVAFYLESISAFLISITSTDYFSLDLA